MVCLLVGASLEWRVLLVMLVVFSVGVFVTNVDCGLDGTSLKRLFRRFKRIVSTGVIVSERANHSGKFNFMRVPGSRRKGTTVTTLGRGRVSKGALTMSITHPERRNPHHGDGCNNNGHNNCNGGHNNNCNNNGHNNNCNNNHSECWSGGVAYLSGRACEKSTQSLFQTSFFVVFITAPFPYV